MAKITVRACPGRTVPLHREDVAFAGNGQFVLAPGAITEVHDSPRIRRRIAAGDLERVVEAAKLSHTTDANDPAAPSGVAK